MTALPDWMHPPREEGWFADDLDNLPEAPRHTELIDGALVFMMSPQRKWHSIVVRRLTNALEEQAPSGVVALQEMTVRLDRRNRPEPDVVVANVPIDDDQTWLDPSGVLLVAEVISPESEDRDRKTKPRMYAEAGIPHYWLVEKENGQPVVHVYQLDTLTTTYVPAGIVRGVLERPVPFPITIDLAALALDRKLGRRG
jgi:Uma2 family endonuclease